MKTKQLGILFLVSFLFIPKAFADGLTVVPNPKYVDERTRQHLEEMQERDDRLNAIKKQKELERLDQRVRGNTSYTPTPAAQSGPVVKKDHLSPEDRRRFNGIMEERDRARASEEGANQRRDSQYYQNKLREESPPPRPSGLSPQDQRDYGYDPGRLPPNLR